MLVARTFGAPPPPRRLRRRPKPREADPEREPSVPLTELTVIDAEAIAGDRETWLESVREDGDRRAEVIGVALARVTSVLSAHRISTADPGVPDPTLEAAVAVRVGYGGGDELVDGRYEAAIEVPQERERASRAAVLRPQERMAALLGGRERPLACEELLLRARADLDAGRTREAALQIRVGLEAMLADREALGGSGQDADLAELNGRRRITGDAANEALRGELSSERAEEIAATAAICERVLRRRAAYGGAAP